MISEQYVWLVWSSAFLVPWAVLFSAFPRHRRSMVWASLFTTPYGLSEPFFVPEYWSPPSLFDLARTTGFDIESLIFCFAIGGVGAVLVNVLTRRQAEPLAPGERQHPRHRVHHLALASPFLVFPFLWLLPWNPIYPGIAAMAVGAVATVACRPDLLRNSLLGAGIFTVYYLAFLLGLELTAPGYIERVWNLDALSGGTLFGLPLEELLFAAAFGGYWAGVYEHFNWNRPRRRPLRRARSIPARCIRRSGRRAPEPAPSAAWLSSPPGCRRRRAGPSGPARCIRRSSVTRRATARSAAWPSSRAPCRRRRRRTPSSST